MKYRLELKAAKIKFRAPCPWIRDLKACNIDNFQILACQAYGRGGAKALVVASIKHGLRKLKTSLKGNKMIRDFKIDKLSGRNYMLMLSSSYCVCRRAGLLKHLILSSKSERGGTLEFLILHEESKPLSELLFKFRKRGVKVNISEIKRLSIRSKLTPKQRNTLKIALTQGYFDYPRKTSLKNLSKVLGLSPSTLNEIIRRGLKNALIELFEFETFSNLHNLLIFKG